MPNYAQILESASLPSVGNWLTAIGVTLGGTFVYDLYQRYRHYIGPADATADFLTHGGIYGLTDNANLNIDQHLDTFRQINDLRNQRQDTTRASLSPLGKLLSGYLREGHSDIDELIVRNIRSIAPGRDFLSDEELEFALQKAIMGGTRTRGWLTYVARLVGTSIDRIRG